MLADETGAEAGLVRINSAQVLLAGIFALCHRFRELVDEDPASLQAAQLPLIRVEHRLECGVVEALALEHACHIQVGLDYVKALRQQLIPAAPRAALGPPGRALLHARLRDPTPVLDRLARLVHRELVAVGPKILPALLQRLVFLVLDGEHFFHEGRPRISDPGAPACQEQGHGHRCQVH